VTVRFLADADLNKAIVSGVLRRESSLDFLTAAAAGLRGMNDPEVLALAANSSECSFHTMSAQCQATSARTEALESVALVYFWYRRAFMWRLRSTNCCSSGWHRKHQNG